MTLVLFKSIAPDEAPIFCSPLSAGIAIRNMLAADRTTEAGQREMAYVLYDSNSEREGSLSDRRGGSNNWDLSADAYVVFAKNKASLRRGLRKLAETDVFAPDGYISIVKNNYSGLGTQFPRYGFMPLRALGVQIKTNAILLKQAGGLFRSRYNEIQDSETGNITKVRSEPVEYVSYARVFNSIRRINATRSGYYLLICQSGDIVDDYDIMGRRCYTVPNRHMSLGAVESLIST